MNRKAEWLNTISVFFRILCFSITIMKLTIILANLNQCKQPKTLIHNTWWLSEWSPKFPFSFTSVQSWVTLDGLNWKRKVFCLWLHPWRQHFLTWQQICYLLLCRCFVVAFNPAKMSLFIRDVAHRPASKQNASRMGWTQTVHFLDKRN